MSEVKLITPPDSIHDSNKSVLLINFNDELKEGFNNAMTGIDFDLNIYLYDFERMLNEQWLDQLYPWLHYNQHKRFGWSLVIGLY